jgi:hypothetical protein
LAEEASAKLLCPVDAAWGKVYTRKFYIDDNQIRQTALNVPGFVWDSISLGTDALKAFSVY